MVMGGFLTQRKVGFAVITWAAAVCLFFLCATVQAASSAHVSRNVVSEGEAFKLVLETDQDETPDWSPLDTDFEVLGTGRSSQIKVINGQVSSSISFTVNLRARKSGSLIIPVLSIGQDKTAPIAIKVNKAGSSANISGAKDIFVEVSVSPKKAYVRQQINYTISLFQAVDIREGSLSKPELSQAVVESLGDDTADTVNRNGMRYRVTKRRFAIFPQTSGTLEIPPTVFNGQVVSGERSRRSFGGFDPFDRFFQQTRAVRLKSKVVKVDVMPQPAEAANDWWLPVSKLNIKQSWSPADPQFNVGDPVTRVIKIEAVGTTESQLPEIEFEDTDRIKFYPDQPGLKTVSNGNTLLATKEIKVAMIPLVGGEYIVPEVRIPWWNTRSNKREVALIAEQRVNITGDAVVSVKQTPSSLIKSAGSSGNMDAAEVESQSTYTWLVAVVALLWLITAAAWWWDRRRYRLADREGKESDKQAFTLRQWRKIFEQACVGNNAQEAALTLISMVQEISGQPGLRNLGQVATLFREETVRVAINQLQANLYSRHREEWQGAKFYQLIMPATEALAEQLQQSGNKAEKDAGLPQLYS